MQAYWPSLGDWVSSGDEDDLIVCLDEDDFE